MSEIILFGAGKYGKAAVKYYGEDNIRYFVDNNSSKWGAKIFDIPIISFEQFQEMIREKQYKIIITSRIYKEIAEQLERVGIVNYELFSELNEKKYYPSKEIVLNPYESSLMSTEEEWNFETQNNPLKRSIRVAVDALYKDVPLFNHIEIETINRCNGICSFCPVNVNVDSRVKTIMDESLFKRIITELKELNYSGRISLFSNNEPLLDERIITFYEYVKENLPNAWIFMFTNGTLLTLEKFKKLIAVLDELVIDNYNQELKLIPNSKEIKEYCEKHEELKEKVTIVLRKPQEILTSRGGDAPNRNILMSYGKETCVLPFKQMIVRPDGKVSLCCNDPLGKNTLGDLNKESLIDVWYGQKFERVREALYKGRSEWKHCVYCDTFNIG